MNQIVRSTLARLALVGVFGPDKWRAEKLRHRLRRLVRDLDMVDLIELKPEFICRHQLQRNDADYRLMLAICHLVALRQMPTEKAGSKALPALDRDAMTLHRVFERFIANFYKAHLTGWKVTSQSLLRWPTTKASLYLPALNPDLVMQDITSGRLVVLDTKFTAAILTAGRWGNLTFSRDHLFQIYAYLRSQEQESQQHGSATGVLLYPTVKHSMSETVEIQGHMIRWETIDLSLPWEMIESELLRIPIAAAT